eukprot:10593744-Heterocapsa_arctica.AAC.1
MEDSLASCVDRYLELAGPGTKIKHASSHFLADDQNKSLVRKPLRPGPCVECPWCKHISVDQKGGGNAAAAPFVSYEVILAVETIQPTMNDTGNCIRPDGVIPMVNSLLGPE